MNERGLTRRQFLVRAVGAAGLLGLSAAGAYGTLYEPFDYELTQTDIFIRDLPDAFDGFRIVQLTDVHHSRLVALDEIRRVVELAQKARPDLIVLTGDFVTSRRSYIEPCAEALGALDAPAGVFAVLGNHDHHTDGELMTRALTRHKIQVLENANTTLRRGGATLQLAGIDDWGWGKTDWTRAMRGLDASRPSLLLSHEPAVFDAPQARSFSFIITGHTHGGQIALPFIGAPARFLPQFRYISGLYTRDATQLYVSRGTGVIGIPVRLGARPEIASFRLRQRKED